MITNDFVYKWTHTRSCIYCERKFNKQAYYKHPLKRTKDHIVPYSKGGCLGELYNKLHCCFQCNTNKGDMLLEDWKEKLINNSFYPNRQIILVNIERVNIISIKYYRKNTLTSVPVGC